MGRTYETIFRLIAGVALSLILVAPELSGANEETGTSAAIEGFALPIYGKGGSNLQFILYGEKAVNIGSLLHLTTIRLDMVDDGVKDINSIVPLDQVKIYPLRTSEEKVRQFWADKKHSRGLIYAPAAKYDKTQKVLRGDGDVFFRSREIDIDGVGFDAFSERRLIRIRSRVRVVLRPEFRKMPEGKN